MKNFSTVVIASCFALTVSCGRDSKSGSNPQMTLPSPETTPPSVEVLTPTETQGTYRVVMEPLNISAGPHKSNGTADIKIIEDDFKLRLTMLDTPAGVKHLQYISTGAECPSAAMDINTDGFIDGTEVINDTHKILIPLDGDITSQTSGENVFPKSDRGGYYNYTKSTSLSKLMEDLMAPVAGDLLVKLMPEESINLNQRHLIVMGVSENFALPATVNGVNGLTKNQSLPIACGKIVKVIEE